MGTKLKLSIEQIKQDFVLFTVLVLGYSIKPFHKKWADFQINNRKTLILAPRDHGKSIILTISYTIWKLINNPDLKILIASNSTTMAKRFLSAIREHFERNTTLRALFGDWVGEKWTDEALTVNKRRKIGVKEPSVSATAVFASLVSGHYDIIIADDLVDFENSLTKGQRDKVWNWFWTVLYPTLETNDVDASKSGKIHIIGTRYHPDDLYGRLINGLDGRGGAFANNYICDKALSVDENGNYVALWPERKSVQTLLETKHSAGSTIFSLQYQNDASMMVGTKFKEEHLNNFWETLPEDVITVVGYDLAVGKSENNDYFAEVVLSADKNGNFYIREVFRGRLSAPEQFEHIKKTWQRYKFDLAGIESVAYQEAMAQWLRENSSVPVTSVKRRQDKEMRAVKIQNYFENGKVFFPKELTQTVLVLREELLVFPNSEHDDLFDALECAITVATQALSGFWFEFVGEEQENTDNKDIEFEEKRFNEFTFVI